MSNQKITELNALTTPDDADLLAIVDDPGGTPETKKITVANLLAAAGGGGDPFVEIGQWQYNCATQGDFDNWTRGGSGTVFNTGIFDNSLFTGISNNATAGAFFIKHAVTFYDNSKSWYERELMVSVLLSLTGAAGTTISVFGGRNSNTIIQDSGWKMFGVHRSGVTVSAMTDNGTSQTLSAYGSGYLSGRYYNYNHHFTPGVSVKFYRDGVLTNTITTNLPTGALQSTNTLYRICHNHNTTADMSSYIHALTIKARFV